MPTLYLRLYRDRIHFNEEMQLLASATSLPTDHCRLVDRVVWWQVEMQRYDRESAELTIEVVDYAASPQEAEAAWREQSAKEAVRALHFTGLRWEALLPCLAYYDQTAKRLIMDQQGEMPADKGPIIRLQHRVRLAELECGTGWFAYEKAVRWSVDPLRVQVSNAHAIPQLNYVKSFLARQIGKKTVIVDLKLQRIDGVLTIISAQSADLQKIGADILVILRGWQVDQLQRQAKPQWSDNNLLPDVADIDLADLGNIDSLERDLLYYFIDQEDVRNARQLQYLADLMADTYPLMLTVQPQVGFVFVVIGEEMVHCIWELIDSHATYVWSMPGRPSSQRCRQVLEREFAVITQHGRRHYRLAFEPQEDLFFHTVAHEADNPVRDPLIRWRQQVERLLV